MAWWGKALGGAFGFMVGGPLGALMGVAFGHNFDRGMTGIGQSDWKVGIGGNQNRVQAAFFTATFSVMGYIAKADGKVTRRNYLMKVNRTTFRLMKFWINSSQS
jgi:DnaJ like chaperone protein